MAVRDAEGTLEVAVNSMLRQSLPPVEVILVLNGCRDGSEAVAEALAAREARVRIMRSSGAGGVAEAAQLGCEAAACPLIARMDADDIAHSQRLFWQAMTLERWGMDLVTCRVMVKDSLGKGLERFVMWANSLRVPPQFLMERFVESPVIQPGVLMTKASYRAAGGYRVEEGPEDYDLWLRMLEGGARFVQAPEALLQWRDSPTRLTRSHADYSEQRMTATKARYLARMERIRDQGVILAGSGPIGRRLAKLLLAEGVQVKGFFDVAPKKIGKTALDIPIWGPVDLGTRERDAVLLGCVGRGGRERVRTLAQEKGYLEGEDFFACC